MDTLLKKIELSARVLSSQGKIDIATYIEKQKNALERIRSGRQYILCTYYFPSELAQLFDVEFLYIERIVGLTVSCNLLSEHKEYGLPTDLCSYQRVFLQLVEEGVLPKPERIIAVKYPCNSAVVLCEFIHKRYEIPIHYVNVPTLESDLLKMYHLLRSKYGSGQLLSDTVALANQAVEIKRKIDFLRMEYPGIIASDHALKLFTIENDFGNVCAVETLMKMLQMIQEKSRVYVKPDVENVMWMGLIPLYDNSVLSKLESQLPCKFVYEEMWMFGGYQISEEAFIKSLAEKILSGFFFNDWNRAQRLITIMKKLQCRHVINLCQKHCSFLPAKNNWLNSRFESEGITMHVLETDVTLGGFQYDELKRIVSSCVMNGGELDGSQD